MLFNALSNIAAFLTPLLAPTAKGLLTIAPAVAAIAAWFAVRTTRDAFRGKLLSDLLSEYAAEDMRQAIVALYAHLQDPNEGFPETQRRMVSHYFQKIHRLHKARVVTKRFTRHVVSEDQAATFLKIERLERGVNSDYDRSPFAFYADLHGLQRHRPVGVRPNAGQP